MRYRCIALLFCLSAGSAGAQFKASALPMFHVSDLPAITPKVRSIRVVPSQLTIRVGQTVKLEAAISVIVVDAAGRDFGRVDGFDFGIKPGQAADAVPRQITGIRPGTAEMTVHYSREFWKKRSEPVPGATVKINVIP